MSKTEYIWAQKYRPKTIDECALPARLKTVFNDMIKGGELSNMTLVGPPGTGKTTTALALCNQLDLDYVIINASENGNIDTLRTLIRQFASTVSFQSPYKVVILDEADYLNAQSTQPALRGFIEEFSKNCRFILTANYANKIIEPLRSRAPTIDYSFTKKDMEEVIPELLKNVRNMLKEEGVKFEKSDVIEIVKRYKPDFRQIFNIIQNNTRINADGCKELSLMSVSTLDESNFKELMKYLKEKNFSKMRQWCAENTSNNYADIRRQLYENATDYIKPQSIPQMILLISEFDYKESFVVDKEINLVALLTLLMNDISFV